MNKTVRYKTWTFSVDYDRTREVYRRREAVSPYVCQCATCRNFSAGRENIYPEEIRTLLDELGIDRRKEAEIYHLGRREDSLHQYGGWFHFKGRITEGRDGRIDRADGGRTIEAVPVTERFRIAFLKDHALHFFDEMERDELVQMEFLAETAWVIGDEEVE